MGSTSPTNVFVDTQLAIEAIASYGESWRKPVRGLTVKERRYQSTRSDPVYLVNHVVHNYVTNMLGALPGAGTQGLINVTIPYGVAIADKGWASALTEDQSLGLGANVINGKIVQPSVAIAFGKQSVTLPQAIGGKHSA